jgi:hypothetical protein
MSDIQEDRQTAGLVRHIGRLHDANALGRATDAATHLRSAIAVLEPVQRCPKLDRVASLLDEAVSLLLEDLERLSL